MALTEKAEGSQTATLTTEHTLLDTADAGTYVFEVDCNAMVDGDIVELRVYTKVRSSGTQRLAYMGVYAHNQGEENKYSVPVPAMRGAKFTLKQTVGSAGRAFPWTVIQLD